MIYRSMVIAFVAACATALPRVALSADGAVDPGPASEQKDACEGAGGDWEQLPSGDSECQCPGTDDPMAGQNTSTGTEYDSSSCGGDDDDDETIGGTLGGGSGGGGGGGGPTGPKPPGHPDCQEIMNTYNACDDCRRDTFVGSGVAIGAACAFGGFIGCAFAIGGSIWAGGSCGHDLDRCEDYLQQNGCDDDYYHYD